METENHTPSVPEITPETVEDSSDIDSSHRKENLLRRIGRRAGLMFEAIMESTNGGYDIALDIQVEKIKEIQANPDMSEEEKQRVIRRIVDGNIQAHR